MARASLGNIARQIVAIFLATIVIFVVTRAMPQSPVEVYLQSMGLPVTEDNVAALREAWGLDDPLWQQYLSWIVGIFRGDWGTSIVSGGSVRAEFFQRVPMSLALGLGGVLLGCVAGYWLGVCAETNRVASWVSRGLAVISQSIPSFAVATVVIALFSVRWQVVNFYRIDDWTIVVAPTLILALFTAGQLSRVAAAEANQICSEPFFRSAVGRGFSESVVIHRQGARQIWYALVSTLVAKMSWVIGGTTVLEVIFTVPGISQYLVERIQQRDYAVIQSYLLFMVVWMVLSHLILGQILRLLAPHTRSVTT